MIFRHLIRLLSQFFLAETTRITPEWAAYDEPKAQPLTVEQSSKAFTQHPRNFRQSSRVMTIAELFHKSGTSDVLVTAIRTPAGRTLVLDGNHRLVAAHIAQVPCRIIAFVVEYVNEVSWLPDLVHHL